MQEERLLLTKEFAEIMRVSKQTVGNWVRKGKLTNVSVDRTIRIPESEIERLKNKNSKGE